MRTLFCTTVTIWTDFDPSHLELSDLAREAEEGNGFATGQCTEEMPAPKGEVSNFFFGREG